jgi:cardiolipin synthase (CMP-forming)
MDGPLWWIMMLVLLAIATDYFDGRVARWSHSVSDWGKVLDPLADKIGGGMVVAALAFKGALPIWFLILLATRDLCILGGGAILKRRTGRIVLSLWAGKIAVTGVAVTSLAALLKADAPVLEFCIWVTVALLVYSFFRYFIRFFSLLKAGPIQASEMVNVGDSSNKTALVEMDMNLVRSLDLETPDLGL